MTSTGSRLITRGILAAMCLAVASGIARGQATGPGPAAVPKADGYSMVSGGAASLSSSGNSTVGFGASYGQAANVVVWGFDAAAYSRSGFKSYSGLVYLGIGFGPYRNAAVPAGGDNKSVVFGPVGGMYSAFSTGASNSNPFAGGVLMAPLAGSLMVKVVAGYVFASAGNTLYTNLGFGFKL